MFVPNSVNTTIYYVRTSLRKYYNIIYVHSDNHLDMSNNQNTELYIEVDIDKLPKKIVENFYQSNADSISLLENNTINIQNTTTETQGQNPIELVWSSTTQNTYTPSKIKIQGSDYEIRPVNTTDSQYSLSTDGPRGGYKPLKKTRYAKRKPIDKSITYKDKSSRVIPQTSTAKRTDFFTNRRKNTRITKGRRRMV